MKNKTHLLFLGWFLIVTSTFYGQDSLKQLLLTPIEDSTRIDILGELSSLYIGIDLDSALMYSREAVDLATKINDKERQAYMKKHVGIAYYYKGNFVKVFEYWNASLFTFEEINHSKGTSNLLGNIGAVYNITGDYEKAVEYHLRSLRLAEKDDDNVRRATAFQNIGAVYSNMGEFEKSEEYYLQALELCEKLDYEKCIGIVAMNLSEVYREDNKVPAAKQQIEKAKVIFEKLNDPSLPEAMINSAQLSIIAKNYNQAIRECEEALSLAQANDTKVFIHRSYIMKGKAYLGLKDSDKATIAYIKAKELSKDLGVTVDLKETYSGLSQAYQQSGDYKKASIAKDSLLSINSQLYDIDKDNNISNLQLEFDLENRENEIALLNADIEKSQIQRNFLLATSSFLLLLMGGIGYLYQFSQRKNKIIEDEKNKSDGLLKNILPPETAEELKKNGVVLPKRHEYTTVLFTDFVGFTSVSAEHSPETIVSSVDYYFKEFDRIISRNHLEKIKTIGDAYMCAGGLHKLDSDTQLVTLNTLKAATEIIEFTRKTMAFPPKDIVTFQVRIGIDSGPVVAGVVGQTKFQYDIWGDTVNVASRMETNCEPDKINVSENVYDQITSKNDFLFRGEIDVKNKGKMKMYYLKDGHQN